MAATMAEVMNSKFQRISETISRMDEKLDVKFTEMIEAIRLLAGGGARPSGSGERSLQPLAQVQQQPPGNFQSPIMITDDFVAIGVLQPPLHVHDLMIHEVVDDPIAELKNLQETDGIMAYHCQFEMIRSRVQLPEPYLVSVYLAGLRNDTQMHVRMFQPYTIRQCLAVAKLYEAAHPHIGSTAVTSKFSGFTTMLSAHKRDENSVTKPLASAPGGLTENVPEALRTKKMLIVEEMNDRRDKGLCYFSDEKYSPDHSLNHKKGQKDEELMVNTLEVLDDEDIIFEGAQVSANLKDFELSFQIVPFNTALMAIQNTEFSRSVLHSATRSHISCPQGICQNASEVLIEMWCLDTPPWPPDVTKLLIMIAKLFTRAHKVDENINMGLDESMRKLKVPKISNGCRYGYYILMFLDFIWKDFKYLYEGCGIGVCECGNAYGQCSADTMKVEVNENGGVDGHFKVCHMSDTFVALLMEEWFETAMVTYGDPKISKIKKDVKPPDTHSSFLKTTLNRKKGLLTFELCHGDCDFFIAFIRPQHYHILFQWRFGVLGQIMLLGNSDVVFLKKSYIIKIHGTLCSLWGLWLLLNLLTLEWVVTIDGDLKCKDVHTCFVFDTACKIYSEMIGNVMIDARSTRKYYQFERLMGRAASHITLKCALLQTLFNLSITLQYDICFGECYWRTHHGLVLSSIQLDLIKTRTCPIVYILEIEACSEDFVRDEPYERLDIDFVADYYVSGSASSFEENSNFYKSHFYNEGSFLLSFGKKCDFGTQKVRLSMTSTKVQRDGLQFNMTGKVLSVSYGEFDPEIIMFFSLPRPPEVPTFEP